LLLIRYLSRHSRESLFIPIISFGGLASPIALTCLRVQFHFFIRETIVRAFAYLSFIMQFKFRANNTFAPARLFRGKKRKGKGKKRGKIHSG